MAAAIQAEEKDAGLQDDRLARKQRYVTALEKKLGGRFLEGLFKFKGSYSKFRCAPKAGDLKPTDMDVDKPALDRFPSLAFAGGSGSESSSGEED